MTHSPAALSAPLVYTDGGLETALIFLQGLDLPEFAAFPLLDSAAGRAALEAYFAPFLELAAAQGVPFVLDTPTWRANPSWAPAVGYSPAELARVNRDAVVFARELATRYAPGTPVLVDGVLGPLADGYVVTESLTAEQVRDAYLPQVEALGDADLISAVTMTYPEEGAGAALAARAVGLPAVVSFTVETDGRLPNGATLAEAIARVDELTGGYPAHYMVNCAHPTHFAGVLAEGGDWVGRIGGIRANASRQSHAELDEATELDDGDPLELAAEYRELREAHPSLRVLGGCCGTDIRHVRAIAAAV